MLRLSQYSALSWGLVGGRGSYDGGLVAAGEWRELLLLGDSVIHPEVTRRCRNTLAVLGSFPEVAECARLRVGEALFSLLTPGCQLRTHCGPTNMRLTCHLALIIPDQCQIKVGNGNARTWQEGKCVVFDDSYEHSAENLSQKRRLVLLVNFWHPDIPRGEWETRANAVAA